MLLLLLFFTINWPNFYFVYGCAIVGIAPCHPTLPLILVVCSWLLWLLLEAERWMQGLMVWSSKAVLTCFNLISSRSGSSDLGAGSNQQESSHTSSTTSSSVPCATRKSRRFGSFVFAHDHVNFCLPSKLSTAYANEKTGLRALCQKPCPSLLPQFL